MKDLTMARLLKIVMLMALVSALPFHHALSSEHFSKDQITVVTTHGSHQFTVEIADTFAKRKQGLMNRETLPEDQGMMFIFPKKHILSFWMKDTLLALDLIFFDEKGIYVSHHNNAVPNSIDSIKSNAPAQFVLEINGGLAEELGIGQGTYFKRISSE